MAVTRIWYLGSAGQWWRITGKQRVRPHFSPPLPPPSLHTHTHPTTTTHPLFLTLGFFVGNSDLSQEMLGSVAWLLWVGRAKHPGPFGGSSLGIEVFNVGGWLTHGDYALDTTADFLVACEAWLIPARVRG